MQLWIGGGDNGVACQNSASHSLDHWTRYDQRRTGFLLAQGLRRCGCEVGVERILSGARRETSS